MDNFIKEITPYRILTNLVTWVLYYYICMTYISVDFWINEWDDILLLIFVSYFIWMIIWRIGSIILDPILHKVYKIEEYKKYIKAEKNDKKIEILNTEKNIYRSSIALFICTILTNIFKEVTHNVDFCEINRWLYIVCILLIILFTLSYWKQNRFIKERINSNNKVKQSSFHRK